MVYHSSNRLKTFYSDHVKMLLVRGQSNMLRTRENSYLFGSLPCQSTDITKICQTAKTGHSLHLFQGHLQKSINKY